MSNYRIILILKGIAIGVANIIPGVSGGTIALITRVYTPLLSCIKKINIKSVKMLFKFKFKEFKKYTNFDIFLFCGIGVLLGVIIYSSILTNVLKINPNEDSPPQLMGFFFGLILASIFYVFKRIQKLNFMNYIILFTGILIAVFLYMISVNTEPGNNDYSNYLYIFISGIIGVCGMILPGLSGSFILLIMDNYFLITTSVDKTKKFIFGSHDFMPEDIKYVYILLVFLAGTVTGVLLFSNIIYWFYNKYTNSTLSLLTGFIIGSLLIIWPWINNSNVMYIPREFSLENISTVLCIVIGIVSIYFLEKTSVSQ